MVVLFIFIISVLTTTITISVNYTLKSSKLRGFATELSLVQNTVNDYLAVTSSVDYTVQDITIIPSTDIKEEQFAGETFVGGTVILHTLDLEKLGMPKTMYGNGKTEKDVYAISFETHRVYYIKGYDAGDKTYYTLTDELNNILSGNQETGVATDNIIFTPNNIGWTNQAIMVTVKIPTSIDISSVNVTADNTNITISNAILNGSYNEVVVNSGNITGNFTITVNYTLNGQNQIQTYEVNNYDDIAPTIQVGGQGYEKTIYDSDFYAYIQAVIATDDSYKIKILKYSEGNILEEQALEYFSSDGTDLANGKDIRIRPEVAEYTIYAQDYAGNINIKVVQIDPDIYELVKNWDVNWPGIVKTETGTNTFTFSSTGSNLIDYKIYGNSLQNGIPSVNSPVEIQSVGDKTSNIFDINDFVETYKPYIPDVHQPEFTTFDGYEVLKMYGTVTSAGRAIEYMKGQFKENTSYYISLDFYDVFSPDNGLAGIIISIDYTDGTSYGIMGARGVEKKWRTCSYVTPQNKTVSHIRLTYNTGSAYTYIKNFHIGESTEFNSYEPYDKYIIPIKITGMEGKNILPLNNYSGIVGWNQAETIKVTVEPNTKYKFSIEEFERLSNIDKGNLTMYIYSDEALTTVVSTATFNLPGSTGLIREPYESAVINSGANSELYFKLRNNGGYSTEVNIKGMMLRKSDQTLNYEPYFGTRIYKIFLDEPLRKVGNFVDYIDFENKKLYRNVQVVDNTGTLSIEQSLSGVNDTTVSDIELPEIYTTKGTNYLNVMTKVAPSKTTITHYYKGT